ncbi:MAG: aldo/keto reductase, partial [Pseudonocardia sp.]|nr:aldo/keto reductase [Pseudonocardia sp.]
ETDQVGRELYADSDKEIVAKVAEIAGTRGVSRAQVALAWLLGKPAVTSPIVGVTRPEHLSDAVAAVDLTLTAEETDQLEKPYTPHQVAGFS